MAGTNNSMCSLITNDMKNIMDHDLQCHCLMHHEDVGVCEHTIIWLYTRKKLTSLKEETVVKRRFSILTMILKL
jgi:hypothetical protein